MFSRHLTEAAIAVAVLTSGCSGYNRLLKSKDLQEKYDAAIRYYEKKDYYKAYPLLEELITVYRGTEKAEKLYYYFAYCDYGLKDYVLASHRFKQFTERFPKSQYAEECLFMGAYCHYLNSPKYSLDQTNTKSAIKELQLFINRYPVSARLDSCNTLIDQLRGKLERKSFENARQYYHIRNYKSAVIALGNTLANFPDTRFREECMFLILKANYILAVNSIETKKAQRIKETKEAYIKFADSFPNSKWLREAEGLYENILREQEKLQTEKT